MIWLRYLLIALLIGWPIEAQAAPSNLLANSVYIEIPINSTQEAICGGVVLSPTTILTAAHCVEKANGPITVQDQYANKVTTSQAIYNDGRDLAILTIPLGLNIKPAVMTTTVGIGDEVWVVGAPEGEPFIVTHGYISKIVNEGLKDGCDPLDATGSTIEQRLYLDVRVWEGNSGGGVFDSQGHLIGILTNMQTYQVGDCTATQGAPVELWGIAVGPVSIQAYLKEPH